METGESYDYTIPGSGTAWYTAPRDEGARWAEPYYGAAAKEWFIDYGVPFEWANGPQAGRVRGVVDMSIEVGDFQKLVHSLVVGKTGYGFMTSGAGKFIAHPISDYVGKRTLADLSSEAATPPALAAIYNAMAGGESGHATFVDQVNQETMLVYYDQMQARNGWGIALVFLQSYLMGDQKALQRRKITVSLAISAFVVVLITPYFSRDILDRREISQLSWLTTALLLSNIFLIGILEHGTRSARQAGDSPPMWTSRAWARSRASGRQR